MGIYSRIKGLFFWGAFFLIILASLLIPPQSFSALPGDLVIGNYTLVSQTRVGRTTWDYTYHATITNNGAIGVRNVYAKLTSPATGTTVLADSLTFGEVPAGAAVTSSDTFQIRVDRSYSFDQSNLVWSINYETVNSPPVANAGIDQTAYIGNTVQLNGAGSTDVDGDILTYNWSFVSRPADSVAALSDPTAVNPSFVIDKFGNYEIQLIVNDGKVDSAPDTVAITTQNSKPVATAGPDQTVYAGDTVTLDGSGSSDADNDSLTFRWSFTSVPSGSTAAISETTAIKPSFVPDLPALYVSQLIVSDGKIDSLPDTVSITANVKTTTVPDVAGLTQSAAQSAITTAKLIVGGITMINSPTVPAGQVITQNPVAGTSVAEGSSVSLVISTGPVMVTVPNVLGMTQAAAESAIMAASLTVGTVTTANSDAVPAGNVISQNPTGGNSVPQGTSINFVISLGPQGPVLPPDPSAVAPPVDPTVATTIGASTEFLYTGSNPIQTGVAPGTIEPKRACVLRGRVLSRDGTDLSGVKMSILNHPELGSTVSRADGMFDMAVNGGGYLTVNYEKDGYLTAQRQVNAPWQDYAWLPDVVMIQLDPEVSTIDLSSGEPIQVAQGSIVSDSDGTRRATLLFPQGLQANMTLPDGRTLPLTTLHVRATEYTVGENGHQAMPAELPPTSGYTYAVELSVDEALAADAKDVTFDKPVYNYVENFLGFPVGGIVPVGYYNRSLGQWIPSDNGVVIKILTVTGGMADLDVDGSNQIANASQLAALNITDAERQQLAGLYQPNRSLWRVPIAHFSPWDHNWPKGPPSDATSPKQPAPNKPSVDKPKCEPGSIIGCENQVLGEAVPIAGTPFGLHYQSDRVPGRKEANTLQIPLSGQSVPESLKGINLEVLVAGRNFSYSFSAAPNQSATFTWDGKDAYGRSLQGSQPIDVRIGYVYGAVYLTPAQLDQAFAAFGDSMTRIGARDEVIIWQTWRGKIDPWDARGQGLGGWSLNVHHAYDTSGSVLYLGDGRKRSAQSFNQVITTVAGRDLGFSGDGGPATQALLNAPQGVAIGSDGSIYIADARNNRIRRVGTDGIITTVAGNGNSGYGGDGGPATQAQLSWPHGVAIGSDGSIYISDSHNNRIRHVGTDGIITTVAGNGNEDFSGDGGPATQASLTAAGVAIGPDGAIYIADAWELIHRVAPALPGLSLVDFFIPSEDGSELYVFNSAGRHMRTIDALTGALRYNFTYNVARKLYAVTDNDGNTVAIERDATGNAIAIYSPYGQPTDLSHDANGYLMSITNRWAGESVQLAYTSDGLLTSMTNPRGFAYHYSYDGSGRLTKDEDPAGGFKALERTDITNGYSVKLSTAANHTNTYRVEQLSTGDQRRVNASPSGLKTETVIGTDASETTTYPDGTRVTLVLGPDPRFGMQAPVSKSRTVTIPGGLRVAITSERTATLTDPNDLLSVKTVTQTTNINGRTFSSTYDAASGSATSRTPTGRTSTTTLDSNGRVVESQVPGITPVRFTYDARGRLSDIVQGARAFALKYDAQNLASVTDPLFRTTGFEYDAVGRIRMQTFPDGRQVEYAYDASGNVVSVTPPGRPDHAFNYTLVDLLQSYAPPDIAIGVTSTNLSYNLDRQLTRVMRPDGATVDFGYDSAGRLSTIGYPHGTTTMAYNPATGKLENIIAPDLGVITYVYDGSLLTDTTWSGFVFGSVHKTYDTNFRVTSESVNGANAVSFQYDLDGLLTQAGSLNLSRDSQNGMVTGSTLGNIADTIEYSSFGEVAAYRASSSGTGIFSVDYARDDIGRIVRKTESIDGQTYAYDYAYDTAGRLASVKKDGVEVSQYGYDANGNRLSYTSSGGTVSGTYDNQDRLLRCGTRTYAYTGNGELSSKTDGNQTTAYYQYDALGNLRNVSLADGTEIEYIVDGQNRRIGKKVNGTLVQGFLYRDGLRPIAELDGAGNVVSRFVYAAASNVPDYMVKGGITYRIITDHLGSPRIVVDAASGAVAQRMDYDEFGNVVADSSPGFQPFGFAGGLYDRHTGLVRFGARDYDAEIGRWTAKDPIGFAGGDANLYGYVVDDPINNKDIEGRAGFLLPVVAVVVGVVVIAIVVSPSLLMLDKELKVQQKALGGGGEICQDDMDAYARARRGLALGVEASEAGYEAADKIGVTPGPISPLTAPFVNIIQKVIQWLSGPAAPPVPDAGL